MTAFARSRIPSTCRREESNRLRPQPGRGNRLSLSIAISLAGLLALTNASMTLAFAFAPANARIFAIDTCSSSRGAGMHRRHLPTSLSTGRSYDHCSLMRQLTRQKNWRLQTLPFDEDGPIDKPLEVDNFDAKTTVALIGGQTLLVGLAIAAATALGTANYGLGPGFALSAGIVQAGALATAPLFLLAYVLDFVEKSVPALADVTKATQRSVLALLGRKRKPFIALLTSVALGLAAGVGEEMLFRGVLQTELSSRLGDTSALAVSSIIFGALHAVTPLYAALASLASLFFGYLYIQSQNLAVPIVCHGLYDVGALLWAHWAVTAMSSEEQEKIEQWVGPEEQ